MSDKKPKENMIMAVIPQAEAERVLDALVRAGYTATTVESRGGVLRQAQKILYIGVEAQALTAVLDLIRTHCRHEVAVKGEPEAFTHDQPPVTAQLGGAVIFVWELTQTLNF